MSLENQAVVDLLKDLNIKLERIAENTQTLALEVNTHKNKINELEKDNSGYHKAIAKIVEDSSTAKGGIKVLYAVILIFSGVISGASLTAIGLFFRESNTLAELSATVRTNRNDINILLGGKK